MILKKNIKLRESIRLDSVLPMENKTQNMPRDEMMLTDRLLMKPEVMSDKIFNINIGEKQ